MSERYPYGEGSTVWLAVISLILLVGILVSPKEAVLAAKFVSSGGETELPVLLTGMHASTAGKVHVPSADFEEAAAVSASVVRLNAAIWC